MLPIGMSVAPGRPKPLTAPPWGQRAQRAWGSFHQGVAALVLATGPLRGATTPSSDVSEADPPPNDWL